MDKDLEKAKSYAFRLLGYRARSKSELRQKLLEKGFSQETIIKLQDFLEEYGLVNDAAFAQSWIRNRCNLKPMGKNRLKQELKFKGITGDIITQELAVLNEDKEYELAFNLAQKKLSRGVSKPEKIAPFLERRGFSYPVIKRVMVSLGIA